MKNQMMPEAMEPNEPVGMPEAQEPSEPMMGTKQSMPKALPKVAKAKKKKIRSIQDLRDAAKMMMPKKPMGS